MQLSEIIRRAEKELQTATRNLETAKRRGAPEQAVRNLEAKAEYKKSVVNMVMWAVCVKAEIKRGW